MKQTKEKIPKLRIRKRIFLGEFKIEDYLQKEVSLLVEKYKMLENR